ncbi:uncharacterized protein BDZ99DRAFT_268183 [Mytilinidion resinicola]|uniref:Uncharacterized protein n=1 Tax=Mytilinidion resinicola TaxID=574789 RepID=A0A6A6YVU9_9PEZI|nr:uncharacterized protein BDZ99DRAFT_268183 [Mytilinidion resinicola]KAF2812503.1 hypothetical protein BDZ99DRAFT_268183 [Mytilinidion resinicola]
MVAARVPLADHGEKTARACAASISSVVFGKLRCVVLPSASTGWLCSSSKRADVCHYPRGQIVRRRSQLPRPVEMDVLLPVFQVRAFQTVWAGVEMGLWVAALTSRWWKERRDIAAHVSVNAKSVIVNSLRVHVAPCCTRFSDCASIEAMFQSL